VPAVSASPAKLPDREPTLRVVPLPADVNQHGDIFGGWVMSQVDIAGGVLAAQRARGQRGDRCRELVRVQAARDGGRRRQFLC
jgi:acyl-coenzyme A thioesterase PaaI-like protein